MTIAGRGLKAKTIIALLPQILIEQNRKEKITAAFWEQMRCIAKNTARQGGGYIDKDYSYIAGYTKKDERTGDEIAEDVLKRLEDD